MLYETGQIHVYYGANAYSVSLALVILVHCATVQTATINPAAIAELWWLRWISTSGFVPLWSFPKNGTCWFEFRVRTSDH